MALDPSGVLYFADVYNHRVRRISQDGTITTVAGNGQRGFSGDGGPATSAALFYPQGVAIDPRTGNLYIADSSNFRVRMMTPQGIISTVAGTGQIGFSGDGGPATAAQLAAPSAVALDTAGNLYFTDSTVCYPVGCAGGAAEISNQRVRKVDTSGIITTIAGNGEDGDDSSNGYGGPAISAALCYPEGLTVDGAGNLYILDSMNRVLKVDTNGIITPVRLIDQAGVGRGLNLSVEDYRKAGGAVALDAKGNLYIADFFDQRVLKAAPITSPFLSSVINAGSGGRLAPGSIVSIHGYNLAADVQSSPAGQLPTSLLDTTVTINKIAAPLFYVSPTQLNVQIPFEAPVAAVPIEVKRTTSGVASGSITLTAAAPGIFRIGPYAAIVTSTGEIAAPVGSLGDRPARPAKRGEYVTIYCTGLGDVTNRPASGAPTPAGPPYSETLAQPLVTIGGISSKPVFSGLTPSSVGLYQINVQVPTDAPSGNTLRVTVAIGDASDTVSMALQ